MQKRETIGGFEVPPQRLVDFLTRQDELNVQILRAISQLSDYIKLTVAQGPHNLRALLESGQMVPYHVQAYDMTTAQTDLDYPVPGEADNVVFVSNGSLTGVTVKFNNKDQASIVPVQYLNYRTKIYHLFLTWPAQIGKTLWVATGATGIAEPLLRTASPTPLSGGLQTIYNAMPPGIGDYYSTMVDMRAGNKLMLYVVSTLDAAVTLQVIGNYADSVLLTTDILGGLTVVPIGSVTTQTTDYGLDWDDWHPFIGVRITTTIAPTLGTLAIYAVAQE